MHSHPCDWTDAGCTNRIDCDAEYERNVDGEPEIVCSALVANQTFECEPCRTGRCPECRCIVRLEGHDEDCARVESGEICRFCLKAECEKGPYGHRYASCADCAGEPPEPDGESFRGGEAAAYGRDVQARIQRDLK